jgi:hypothetical protein
LGKVLMIKDSLVSLRPIMGAAALIVALLAAIPAIAQDGNVTIGAPQLRDFQIEPKQRIVTQPAQPAQPAPATAQPAVRSPAAAAPTPSAQPAQQRSAPTTRPEPSRGSPAPETSAAPAAPAAIPTAGEASSAPAATPVPTTGPAPLPAPQAPAISDPPAPLSDGPPLWVFFLAFVTVGLAGYGYWLKRQAAGRRGLAPAANPHEGPLS